MITREIHYALSEIRQCLTTLEVVLPEKLGHMEASGTRRVKIEHVLTFDVDDEVEVEDTPFQRRRRSENISTPDPGPASSSLNSNDIKVIRHCVFSIHLGS